MNNEATKNRLLLRRKSLYQSIPLCVEIEGSLVNTDLFLENIFLVIRKFKKFSLLNYVLKERSLFEARLAEINIPKPDLLPYNKKVLSYLKEQKKLGRYLVLTTSITSKIANSINQHLKIFDEVIASDEKMNLRGKNKLKVLVQRFGYHGFSYFGNKSTDPAIWKSARSGILANTSISYNQRTKKLVEIEAYLPRENLKYESIIKEIRPHHWVKNFLVFVPIILANEFFNLEAWFQALIVFSALCSTASGIYVINDIFDVESDRRHTSKKNRPIASGLISIKFSIVFSLFLILTGLYFAYFTQAFLLVVTYFISAVAYSVFLKTKPLVDIFSLAGLYTIRLLAGGVASGYFVSPWLLAHSSFLFLSLASVKRVTELNKLSDSYRKIAANRGYLIEDAAILQSFGICSSFVSAVVLALYVQSDVAAINYTRPTLLLGVVPVILFWQCRIWIAVSRGNMLDDPIVYSAKDWVSWATIFLICTLLIIANIPI